MSLKTNAPNKQYFACICARVLASPSQTTMFFVVVFSIQFNVHSRLFHSYRDEPIGRWGETGVPRENHLTHLQAELGLSHMWPVRGLNLHQSQR